MIYPIVTIGSAILRKKAIEIDKNYPKLKEIVENMFETMYNAEGVGLAAPQINISIRLFVIDADPFKEDDEYAKDFKRVVINPIIVEKSEEICEFNEGCLSVPEIREEIKRACSVKVKYYNENFELVEEELKGIQSRVFLHEYDHLEGIVFTDHCNALKKRLLKKNLINIAKGLVKTKYKSKVSN